jgi:hypothetical protein
VQDQLISAPASILAPSDVDIPLRLNGVTPEQLALFAFTISSPPRTIAFAGCRRYRLDRPKSTYNFPNSSVKIDRMDEFQWHFVKKCIES